jgi:DNA repair protein RadC
MHDDYYIRKALGILQDRVLEVKKMHNPEEVKQYLLLDLHRRERELFGVLYLNTRHAILAREELFYGTIDSCTVHPREVVRSALKRNAAAIILFHNHPSGDPEPSEADRALTNRIRDALSMVDIRVLDHMVVGSSAVVSFAERGLL